MDHRDIHHIIGDVSKNLFCVHCRKKIVPKGFHLHMVSDKECVLSVVCQSCRTTILLNAVKNAEVPQDQYFLNASTHISLAKQDSQPLSKSDVARVRKALHGFSGGFESLFGKNS